MYILVSRHDESLWEFFQHLWRSKEPTSKRQCLEQSMTTIIAGLYKAYENKQIHVLREYRLTNAVVFNLLHIFSSCYNKPICFDVGKFLLSFIKHWLKEHIWLYHCQMSLRREKFKICSCKTKAKIVTVFQHVKQKNLVRLVSKIIHEHYDTRCSSNF